MPLRVDVLSPEQLAGLVTAIAALIGALGFRAIREGKKERERGDIPPALLTRDRFDEEISDVKGLIRSHHSETRVDHRDTRDRLIQIDGKLNSRRD